MDEKTRTVSWRVSEDLYNQVLRAGVADGRNMSGMLTVCVKLGLAAHRAGKVAEKKNNG